MATIYAGQEVAESGVVNLGIGSVLIALIVIGYRIGRQRRWFDDIRYSPLVGWGMLALFVVLASGACFMAAYAMLGTFIPEAPLSGYHALDFFLDVAIAAWFFLVGFSLATGARLLYPGRVPFWRLLRAIELRLFSRPLLVLRALSLAIIVFLIGGAWFAIATSRRLAAIERALGGQDMLRCDPQEAIEGIRPSVVRVVGGLGEGSGFAVADHYIMTNHHVIEGEPSPKIVYADGQFENGVVVAADAEKDLAAIYVHRNLTPISWAPDSSPYIGQALFLLGYPYGGNINGQATVNRTAISAFRDGGDVVVQYIQTDGGLIEGMSGGPMVNLCGKAVGVNAAGGENMGIGIDVLTARGWLYSATLQRPTTPWESQAEEINPDASPIDAVRAYYAYISARNYEAAFAMLSDRFVGDVLYEDWILGFETQLQTAIYSVKTDPRNRWRVLVKIESTDIVNGDIVYREFAGSWLVRDINGHLRLWESNIKEITDL